MFRDRVVLTSVLTVMLVFAGVAWLHAVQLDEAYGSGPPYYGRTTNMDKWESPLPLLFVVDAIALGITALLFAVIGRKKRDVEPRTHDGNPDRPGR